MQIPKVGEDGTKTYVDVGPGRHGFPQLVPYVERFEREVKRLLDSPPLSDQVRPGPPTLSFKSVAVVHRKHVCGFVFVLLCSALAAQVGGAQQ